MGMLSGSKGEGEFQAAMMEKLKELNLPPGVCEPDSDSGSQLFNERKVDEYLESLRSKRTAGAPGAAWQQGAQSLMLETAPVSTQLYVCMCTCAQGCRQGCMYVYVEGSQHTILHVEGWQ